MQMALPVYLFSLLQAIAALSFLAGCGGESGGALATDTTGAQQPDTRASVRTEAPLLPVGYYRDTHTGEELLVLQEGQAVWYAANNRAEWKLMIRGTSDGVIETEYCFPNGTCHRLSKDPESNRIQCQNPDNSQQLFSRVELASTLNQMLLNSQCGACDNSTAFSEWLNQRYGAVNHQYLLKTEVSRAIRDSDHRITRPDTLTWVILTSEKKIILRDTSETDFNFNYNYKYYYVGHIPHLKMYVFEKAYMEGDVFLMINEITGETLASANVPSPNPFNQSEFLVLRDCFLGACYSGIEFTVNKIENNQFVTTWENPDFIDFRKQQTYGFDNPIWISRDTLILTKSWILDGNSNETNLPHVFHFPVYFIRTGNTWQERPFHLP
jgi:hypothetical protein